MTEVPQEWWDEAEREAVRRGLLTPVRDKNGKTVLVHDSKGKLVPLYERTAPFSERN
jgi:hypothetical protein